MITNVTVPALLCLCDVCSHEWVSVAFTKRPSHCANPECRSREWNGKKQRKAPEKKPVIVMPPPVKIRGGTDDGDW
jgi:hypothetical protein